MFSYGALFCFQIYEMAAVMQRAVHLDEDSYLAQQEYVSRLETENQGLRDLLLISNGHLGSHFNSKTQELPMVNHNSNDTDHVNEKDRISPSSENTLT